MIHSGGNPLNTRRCSIVLVFLAILLASSCARNNSLDLNQLVADLLSSDTEEDLQTALQALEESQADPLEVARLLRSGPNEFPDSTPGWQVHEMQCQDGKTRNFHVFIPDSYDPSRPHPLLISLHGSVMQAGYTIEQFLFRRVMWEEVAQRDGFIILMPHGDRDAPWWSEASRQNTRDMLRWAKRACNIDENRVFLAGFSDGAAGTYWMAFHDPTPWAGFIPIYGAVTSPERGPYQCYPSNLNQRMVLASNGAAESYIRTAASLINQLQAQGISISWTLHPTEHNLVQAMAYERDRSSEFIAAATRDPHRSIIAWKTAHIETGRCDWIEVTDIRVLDQPNRVADLNLSWESEAVQFGVGIEFRGADEGFVVSGVEPGTIARELGIKNGDKLVRIDQMPVRTQMEVSIAMEAKTMGDPIEVEVLRGEENLVFQGVLPEYPPAYRRDLPTAAVFAKADGNTVEIETQNVGQLKVYVSDSMFDLTQPIQVVCNGETRFLNRIEPSLNTVLSQWIKDWDRATVFVAEIVIDLPDGG